MTAPDPRLTLLADPACPPALWLRCALDLLGWQDARILPDPHELQACQALLRAVTPLAPALDLGDSAAHRPPHASSPDTSASTPTGGPPASSTLSDSPSSLPNTPATAPPASSVVHAFDTPS